MATRCSFLVVVCTMLFYTSFTQDTQQDAIPIEPEIGVPWKAQDLPAGQSETSLAAAQPLLFFDGHYTGTSSSRGMTADRCLMSLWGEGEATQVGPSSLGYAWHYDAATGQRISTPEGDIICKGGRLHFLVTEEYPDEYHGNILCQAGVITGGTGTFDGTSGTWEATLLVFGNDDGTFEWRMHIYGWLDVAKTQM